MNDDGYISVTQLLTHLGFVDYSFVPPEKRAAAMAHGRAVAEATMLMDLAGQKYGTHWNPAMDGYLVAWSLFKREFNFKPTMIEQELEDPVRRLKGRPDREGYCHRRYGGLIVVEQKTGGLAKWHKFQTALYEYLIRAKGGDRRLDSSRNRWVVLLRPDGTYIPRRHVDPNDLRIVFRKWRDFNRG